MTASIHAVPLLVMGFLGGSDSKESSCNAGDLSSIPGLGRSTGEGSSYPLQYSGLENSMDGLAYEVSKSRTRLRDLHFTSLLYHTEPNVAKFVPYS